VKLIEEQELENTGIKEHDQQECQDLNPQRSPETTSSTLGYKA